MLVHSTTRTVFSFASRAIPLLLSTDQRALANATNLFGFLAGFVDFAFLASQDRRWGAFRCLELLWLLFVLEFGDDRGNAAFSDCRFQNVRMYLAIR